MSEDRLPRLAATFAEQLGTPGTGQEEAARRAHRRQTAAELLTKERIPTLSEVDLRGFFEQLDAMRYFFKVDDLIAGSGVEGLRSALRALVSSAEDGSLGNNLKKSFPVAGQGAGPGLISQIINARFPERYWVYSLDTTPKHLRHLGLKLPGDLNAISYTAAGPYMQQVQQSLVLAGIKSADYLTVDQFLWWAYWEQPPEPEAQKLDLLAREFARVLQTEKALQDQVSRRKQHSAWAQEHLTRERIPTLSEPELLDFFGKLDHFPGVGSTKANFDRMVQHIGLDGLHNALLNLVVCGEQGLSTDDLKEFFPDYLFHLI